MTVILVLLSLSLAGVALWAFFWAINSNQFDDLDSPAMSIFKDEPPEEPSEEPSEESSKESGQDQKKPQAKG